MQAQHEVAMPELADLYVEEEEKTFSDEEAGRPVEAASVEIDRPKMDDVRGEDCNQKAKRAEEEEIAQDGGRIYAVVRFGRLVWGMPRDPPKRLTSIPDISCRDYSCLVSQYNSAACHPRG